MIKQTLIAGLIGLAALVSGCSHQEKRIRTDSDWGPYIFPQVITAEELYEEFAKDFRIDLK